MRLPNAIHRPLALLLPLALVASAAAPARAADPRDNAWWKAGRAAAVLYLAGAFGSSESPW